MALGFTFIKVIFRLLGWILLIKKKLQNNVKFYLVLKSCAPLQPALDYNFLKKTP